MFKNSEVFLEIAKTFGGKYVLMYSAHLLENTDDTIYEPDDARYYLHLNDQFNRWTPYEIHQFTRADSDYIGQIFDAMIFDSREDVIKYLKNNRDRLSIPTYQFGNSFHAVQIPTVEQLTSAISKDVTKGYNVSSIMHNLLLSPDKEFDERIGLDQVWFNLKPSKN